MSVLEVRGLRHDQDTTDAISLAADGTVTFNNDTVVTGTMTVNGGVTGNLDSSALTGALPAIDGSALTGIEGVPSGVICMWGGLVANIPSGWYLCDGANGTPNLSGKFIKGTTGNPGATGGSTSTDGTTLSVAQIPSHNHSMDGNPGDDSGFGPRQASSGGTRYTGSTGGGGSHSHTFEPPYYSLCYIQKA